MLQDDKKYITYRWFISFLQEDMMNVCIEGIINCTQN